MIDSLRAKNKSFALVDLGDFMNNEITVGDLKTRVIWKLMEQMGYCASTPGIREMTNWKLYQELLSTSTIRCVATNLKVVEGGVEKPAGLPYFVTVVGGVRVGFFSLVGPNEVTTAKPPDGIQFRPEEALQTARRIVPELRKQAEVVVLMSEMSPSETDDLVKQVQGIDVALYGHSPAWNDRAVKIAATITQQTGIRGQFSGELVLIVDPDGRVAEWGSRNTALDNIFPEKAEVAAQLKQLDDQTKEMLRTDQQKKTSELENKISSDKFIGVQKCERCHEAQYQQWQTTAHAKAYATLAGMSKQTDDKCVGCHVTGWQKEGGFALTTMEVDMTNVQCESCHDVGTKHARGSMAAKITEATCTPCHTGDWGKAKGFDFATYLKKVAH